MTIYRRVARLSPEHYLGRQSYFVTICCDQRVPHLRSETTARRVLALLFECAARHSCRLHAYCLMPDHVHILAEGAHDGCDLREFIRLFKQHTAFDFRNSHGRALWEKSYYDHILRTADALEDVACYIWWNPVRKEICARPEEFPYSGSHTMDWIKHAASGTSWSAPWKKASVVAGLQTGPKKHGSEDPPPQA